jgi:hypothetical protein
MLGSAPRSNSASAAAAISSRVRCVSRRLASLVISHEEIVELVSARRFSYRLLSGLAIRGYRADIDLEPTEEGTVIRWHSSFDPKLWRRLR